MDTVPFARNADIEVTAADFVGRVASPIEDKQHLFRALQDALNIPSYFGHNWAALDECLSDLGWIPNPRIILIHAGAPRLGHKELRIYLEILRDGIEALSERRRALIVGFPEQSRALRDAWNSVKR